MSKIKRISSPAVTEPPPGLWSNCLVVDGIAYISGMTARARGDFGTVEDVGAYEQAKIIFAKIRDLLRAAGGEMADVVKITIYVTDIRDRKEVWRARQEVFTGNFPASTLVQVAALAEPAMKVEIEAIAHLGASAA
ncbi:MAG: RidA family protein [Alphaproteobacteria bacterium]